MKSPFEIINEWVQHQGLTERILFSLSDAGYQIRKDPLAGLWMMGDVSCPPDQMLIVQNGKVVGRITGIGESDEDVS